MQRIKQMPMPRAGHLSLPLPQDLERIRGAARRALGPVQPAGSNTPWLIAKRTWVGQQMPPYYLVYFLLVDLLGFENFGKHEKVAWSVPINFNGRLFFIEHRKLGLDIFADDPNGEKEAARLIVAHIQKAVKVAEPFFEWLAAQAIKESRVNVLNKSESLFDRFTFFLEAYRAKAKETHDRKDERVVDRSETEHSSWESVSFPSWRLKKESRWLALAAIEAFFGWTEHVFVHISILTGKVKTAIEVTALAEAEWAEKFKKAMDLSDPKTKILFDQLIVIRRELRNTIAHGAFGKLGEAFAFHSGAGAVPVLLPHVAGSRKFLLGGGLTFEDEAALGVIENFIKHIWAGGRSPAQIYLSSDLPLILTLAANGTYSRAMSSVEDMTGFVACLTRSFDDAANMDW
jgi:hypothetical protein